MALHALPNESVNSIGTLISYLDNTVEGILVAGILVVAFIIIIMACMVRDYDLPESGVIGGFIIGLVAMLFTFAGFAVEWYLWVFVAISIIGSGFLYLKKNY